LRGYSRNSGLPSIKTCCQPRGCLGWGVPLRVQELPPEVSPASLRHALLQDHAHGELEPHCLDTHRGWVALGEKVVARINRVGVNKRHQYVSRITTNYKVLHGNRVFTHPVHMVK